MVKEYKYKGKTPEELERMPLSELLKLLSARSRRKLNRGLTDEHKELLAKVEEAKAGKRKKPVKTHARDMIILPKMYGVKIMVYNGKEFIPVEIRPEMTGHVLGEFALTRKEVKHKAPGVGATRGSKHTSAK
jgi:small subunit ribosomal protein S19